MPGAAGGQTGARPLSCPANLFSWVLMAAGRDAPGRRRATAEQAQASRRLCRCRAGAV